MYKKRLGTTSIIETTFIILMVGILSVSTLYLKDILYVSKARSVIDYIEKQDSMWREIKDIGYTPFNGAGNIASLRSNNSCQEVTTDDPTAVVLFNTHNNINWSYLKWENHAYNCLYVLLGLLPREIGMRIGKSLDARTRLDAVFSNSWSGEGVRKKNIWIGKNEFSPSGVKGFETYARSLGSNMTGASLTGDVMDAYFLDHKMSTDKQSIIIVSGLAANSEISRTCSGSCKARTNISGKLIHFIETKGKNSLVSRRYAHCSINNQGCAMPKSAFTGLTVNTGIGPIENMTGSSCSNRKSTKNECILVTRRMQEFAPWEDWDTIDNRPWDVTAHNQNWNAIN